MPLGIAAACAGRSAQTPRPLDTLEDRAELDAGTDLAPRVARAEPAKSERLCAIRTGSRRGIEHEYRDEKQRLVRLTRPTRTTLRMPFVRIEYDSLGRIAVLERDRDGSHGPARARFSYDGDTGFITSVEIDGAERARRARYTYRGTRLAGSGRFRVDPASLDLWDAELELLPGEEIPFSGELVIEEQPDASGRRFEAVYDTRGRLTLLRHFRRAAGEADVFRYVRDATGRVSEIEAVPARGGGVERSRQRSPSSEESVERRCP